jgi:MerR family transcriptional regulator, thiopeptide resistance regulator
VGWPINEVARMSKVTSRTLRHYDAIGLLPPAWTDSAGRRHYGRDELLRLQQIRLLRDLGLGLGAIREVLDAQSGQNTVAVLRKHREWLAAERRRLGRLITTVERTIAHVEKGGEMAPEKLFEGFDENPYEAEARERWGDQAVDDSYAKMRQWTPEQAEQARIGFVQHSGAVRDLRDSGVPVDDERVQQAVAGLYEWLTLFWTPNRAAFIGLANMYVDDERFRRNIGQGDDQLVEYLRDAMKGYAEARLS